MGDQNDPDDLLARVKVTPQDGGVDIAVSDQVPALLGRVLRPQRWSQKGYAHGAVSDRIVEMLRRGETLGKAELEFAKHTMGDQVAKYARQKAIVERAMAIATPRLSAGAPKGDEETSQDWVNHFRENAGLVSGEMIQELYSHVLAEETVKPSSISLLTLGVLRHLDSRAAKKFLGAISLLVDGRNVPYQGGRGQALHTSAGSDFDSLLELEEAGLINASANTQEAWRSEDGYLRVPLQGQRAAVMLSRPGEAEFQLELSVHILTRAGRQLAPLLIVEPSDNVFMGLLDCIRHESKGCTISIARLNSAWGELPSVDSPLWKPWSE